MENLGNFQMCRSPDQKRSQYFGRWLLTIRMLREYTLKSKIFRSTKIGGKKVFLLKVASFNVSLCMIQARDDGLCVSFLININLENEKTENVNKKQKS